MSAAVLAAAVQAYLGAYSDNFRTEIVNSSWLPILTERGLPVLRWGGDNDFKLSQVSYQVLVIRAEHVLPPLIRCAFTDSSIACIRETGSPME